MNWFKKAQSYWLGEEGEQDHRLDDLGLDPYDVLDGLEKSFSDSGVRPDSTKQPSFVLHDDDNGVTGGSYGGWSDAAEDNVKEYSFDIAVSPLARGNPSKFLDLVKIGRAHV